MRTADSLEQGCAGAGGGTEMETAKSADKSAGSLFPSQLGVTNGLIYIISYFKQQHGQLPGDPSLGGFYCVFF